MSTTQPPRPTQLAPTTPTRQLLDELDELMQRMLQLPVQQVADEPAASSAPLVVPTVAPPLPLDNPVTRELPPPEPEVDHPSAAPPAPVAAPIFPKPAPVVRPARAKETTPFRQPSSQTPSPAAPPRPTRVPISYLVRGRQPSAREQSPVSAWYLQPLVWSNRTFDRCTAWLGGPGSWLRSESGRNLLGWTGVLLLTIAVAWGLLKWLATG